LLSTVNGALLILKLNRTSALHTNILHKIAPKKQAHKLHYTKYFAINRNKTIENGEKNPQVYSTNILYKKIQYRRKIS